jgi:hypothetical protein
MPDYVEEFFKYAKAEAQDPKSIDELLRNAGFVDEAGAERLKCCVATWTERAEQLIASGEDPNELANIEAALKVAEEYLAQLSETPEQVQPKK